MKQLLHVIASMDPKLGGVSQAVRTIIMGLAELGIHNEAVSLDAPYAPWSVTDSFPVHSIGLGKGPWSYNSQLIPWLLDNLSRFDAVILHGLWLYNGYALHKVLRHLKSQCAVGAEKSSFPKLFIMPHGMLDPYFQRATGRRLKAWRNWIYWQFIESSVINDADGVLFTCETERLLAREPFTPYLPQREIVVGLGVEEPPTYTLAMRNAFLAKCPELRDRPYLLFLSRIHEKKGVDLLIQAYLNLASIPTNPLNEIEGTQKLSAVPALVIAGPGLETVYGKRIHQIVVNLPESTSIYFSGMLTGDAKWGAFYSCEAFILPSHQENFGIAVVESLACSKPVLISNQVNIWREIDATGGGMVADDTLAGTQQLLENWCKLTKFEKQGFAERALASYYQHFAMKPASEKLFAAIK